MRMVLEHLGVVRSEEELRYLTDCLYDGTRDLIAVDVARSLGFEATRKYSQLKPEDLDTLITEGVYPIVHLRTKPVADCPPHAVVVVSVLGISVDVLDPLRGEVTLPMDDFLREWSATKRFTLVIR